MMRLLLSSTSMIPVFSTSIVADAAAPAIAYSTKSRFLESAAPWNETKEKGCFGPGEEKEQDDPARPTAFLCNSGESFESCRQQLIKSCQTECKGDPSCVGYSIPTKRLTNTRASDEVWVTKYAKKHGCQICQNGQPLEKKVWWSAFMKPEELPDSIRGGFKRWEDAFNCEPGLKPADKATMHKINGKIWSDVGDDWGSFEAGFLESCEEEGQRSGRGFNIIDVVVLNGEVSRVACGFAFIADFKQFCYKKNTHEIYLKDIEEIDELGFCFPEAINLDNRREQLTDDCKCRLKRHAVTKDFDICLKGQYCYDYKPKPCRDLPRCYDLAQFDDLRGPEQIDEREKVVLTDKCACHGNAATEGPTCNPNDLCRTSMIPECLTP